MFRAYTPQDGGTRDRAGRRACGAGSQAHLTPKREGEVDAVWRGAAGPVLAVLALLWVPSPASAEEYVVRAGDTLWRISHHLGVRPLDLAAANHLVLTDTIHPGLRLTVPGGAPRAAVPSTSSTPAPRPEHAAKASAPALTTSPAPARASAFSLAAVRIATRLLGKPYEWSGTGGRGFDCSGLVAHVFASLGRPLPHSSFAQYEAGTGVAWEDLAPGDLVFFRTYSLGASHVGIYIGDSRFIHSSYSRGVIVSSLEEPYFRGRFIGGRRL